MHTLALEPAVHSLVATTCRCKVGILRLQQHTMWLRDYTGWTQTLAVGPAAAMQHNQHLQGHTPLSWIVQLKQGRATRVQHLTSRQPHAGPASQHRIDVSSAALQQGGVNHMAWATSNDTTSNNTAPLLPSSTGVPPSPCSAAQVFLLRVRCAAAPPGYPRLPAAQSRWALCASQKTCRWSRTCAARTIPAPSQTWCA